MSELPDQIPFTTEPEPIPDTSGAHSAIQLVPFLPDDIDRYHIADKYVHTVKHKIWPLLFCNPTEPWARNSRYHWDRYVHPEGVPYYCHAVKQVVIVSDPWEDDVNDTIKAVIEEVKRRMQHHLPIESVQEKFHEVRPDVTITYDEWHYGVPEWELFVDIDTGTKVCHYYIADWSKRCIFWLEDDPDALDAEDPKCLTTAKLRMHAPASYDHTLTMFESQFWKHVEYFSQHRDLPEGSFEELKGWFLWGITDRLMGLNQSTIVRDSKELESYLSLLTSQTWDTMPKAKRYLSAVVARHWCDITLDRSHNLYGEHEARLSREQSRYFESPYSPPNIVARILSILLLFNQPHSWHTKLCELWVDKTVFLDTWRDMMRDVQEEWGSMGFQSTVILASNMGFLTINPVGDSKVASAQVARTLSVISTMLSIGSIMCSMLLSHDHRDMGRATFAMEGVYFEACKNHIFGLFGAAMIYSLPFAMLLWALIIFIAAILSFSFANWETLSSPFTAFFTAFTLLLVVCQTVYFWRGARKYGGSTWEMPPERDESTADRPKPRMLKMQTFSTLRRSFSISSTVGGLIRRGSKVLQRSMTWSSMSPTSTSKRFLPNIPASNAGSTCTDVEGHSDMPQTPTISSPRTRTARKNSNLRVSLPRTSSVDVFRSSSSGSPGTYESNSPSRRLWMPSLGRRREEHILPLTTNSALHPVISQISSDAISIVQVIPT